MTAEHRVDLLRLSPRERECYDVGRLFGYVEGHEAGVKWADDRAAALWRDCARFVHRMAGLPEVDPDDARRRRDARDRRWSA